MSWNSGGEGPKTVLMIFVIALIVVAFVYAMLNRPDYNQECRDRAYVLDLPCIYDSIVWDDDECECISNDDRAYEIEFNLNHSHGCVMDD